MSMTREEAAHILEYSRIVSENFTQEAVTATYVMALAALRPVSREQVKKVWRGWWGKDSEYMPIYVCSKCGERNLFRNGNNVLSNFCPSCGAPMTDEAAQMVMERLEELHETVE